MHSSPISRIVLTGFMGAGKSTLGALLAAELRWQFFDLDDVLVQAQGRSIAHIFEQAGEAAFRRLEEEAIGRLLSLDHTVVALGGGALESAETRSLLLSSHGTHLIFLETPLEVALARCAQEPGSAVRPVLQDRDALARRFDQRLEHYRSAHQIIATAGRTPAELTTLLLTSLVTRLTPAKP